MKTFKLIMAFVGMVISGMFGGQKNKSARRFGLPLIALGISQEDGFQWRDLTMLLLIPVLAMGYGENSVLMGWLGVDWAVRLVYAVLLSLPFLVYGIKRWGFAVASLIVAFQVHAGSLGHVEWFGDFLMEDIIRYGVLAALVLFNIEERKKQ